jgi:hypothetical protein
MDNMKTHSYTTTIEERISEMERELHKRKQVYPGWVRSGKIKAVVAAKRLQLQHDILQDLRKLQEQEQGTQKRLF